MLVCGIFVAFTIVGFRVVLAQTQVELDRLRARTAVAEQRYDAARYENGRLASPARITGRARELGLVVPAVAPVAVPVAGALPQRGGQSSVLANWGEVKRHLDASP